MVFRAHWGREKSGNNVNRHSQALPLIVGMDDGTQKQKKGGGNGNVSWCGNDRVKTNTPGLAYWECKCSTRELPRQESSALVCPCQIILECFFFIYLPLEAFLAIWGCGLKQR